MQTLPVEAPVRPPAAFTLALMQHRAQPMPVDATLPAAAPPGDLRRWVDQDFEEYFFE